MTLKNNRRQEPLKLTDAIRETTREDESYQIRSDQIRSVAQSYSLCLKHAFYSWCNGRDFGEF